MARHHRRSAARFGGVPYAFAAPAVLLFAATILVPLGYTAYLSFQKIHVSGLGLGPGSHRQVFAGWSNYTSVLHDSEFWHSILRVLLYGAILIPVMLGLATLFALLLDARRVRFQRFGRIAVFLPYAVPTVISSLLWGFLYLPSVSPFSTVLNTAGLSSPNFFGTHTIFLSVANIGVWGGTGFNMMVLYTALRALPGETYEAARLDGASELQIALRVKLPMIRPALIVTAFFSTVTTLQVFNEPNTIRPLTNIISTTWTPLMKVQHDAFTDNDIYVASAESFIIALLIFVFSFAVLRVMNRGAFTEEPR